MKSPKKLFEQKNSIGKQGEAITKDIIRILHKGIGVTFFDIPRGYNDYDIKFISDAPDAKRVTTIEVKHDILSTDTGNFCCELMTYDPDEEEYVFSGFLKTTAYLTVLLSREKHSWNNYNAYFIKTKNLWEIIREHGTKKDVGYAQKTIAALVPKQIFIDNQLKYNIKIYHYDMHSNELNYIGE